jgi:peptidoglycan/LPS O-acetylase OafA/YrhL
MTFLASPLSDWIQARFTEIQTGVRQVGPLTSGQSFATVHLPASLLCFRNYVGKTGGGPTVHFWSLSLEEQFYLAWPALLIVAGRKRSLWIAVAGAVGIAAWRLHCWAWLNMLRPSATYGAQYRADSILIGCALALLVPRVAPLVRKWMSLPLLAILIYCLTRDFTLIPLYESVMIALLLLITVQNPRGFAGRVLETKPLVKIGQFSYSIYVWQMILFAAHSASGALFSFAFMLIAAMISYFFVEEPSIKYGKLIQARWQRANA